MEILLLLGAFSAQLGVAAAPSPSSLSQELEKLRGTWEAVRVTVEGELTPPGMCKVKMVIAGTRVRMRSEVKSGSTDAEKKLGLTDEESVLTIDPDSIPNRFTTRSLILATDGQVFNNPGMTTYCVYKLEGDQLTLSLPNAPGQDAPRDFHSSGNIVVFSKVKR